MAGWAVCETESQRRQYDWFCDMHRKALAISQIKAVRQIITRSGQLVSEVQVQAGAVPFLNDFTPFSYSGGLPVTIDGALVSTADWTVAANDTAFELYMDTVEIKGSNLPGVRQLLDRRGPVLESWQLSDVLERTVSSYHTQTSVHHRLFG